MSLAGALVLGGAVTLSFIFRKAQRAVADSVSKATHASVIPFTVSSLTPTIGPAGLVTFTSRGGFESFVVFEGEIFVCNRSTLFRYDNRGQLLQTWRVGLDFPPFPLVRLAVRRGIPQPELWIATDGAGALIWDGRAFRQLTPQAGPLRKLTSLLNLSDGKMLVGTLNAGLYVTDTQRFALFRPELQNVPITVLAHGVTSEEVWIGTRTQGVWLWRAGTLSRLVSELPDPQVLSVSGGGAGVWVGTANGVAEFIDGRFRRHLADGIFASALAERAGTLWISTLEEGTLSLDLRVHTPRPSGGIRTISRNAFHSIELLPIAGGVLALGDSNIRHLPEAGSVLDEPPSGLTNGHITALNVDNKKRLWVGYFDRGLDLLSNDLRLTAEHFETDVLFCINRIKQDASSNRVLVGTANGLVLFDGSFERPRVLKTSDGLISNHVTDVLFSEPSAGEQSTVVATASGITFMNGPRVSSVYAFQGLVNNHVYTLAQAGPLLIAGTLGGVSLLKNALVQASFTTANSSLLQNWITSSAVSGDDIYLGTYGSGVMRMNSRLQVESFREFSGVRIEINPNAMLVTKRGVYAGTATKGLAFLPTGQQRWHFWQTGLPSTSVTALAADGDNLYIGTDNGLVRIPERAFNL